MENTSTVVYTACSTVPGHYFTDIFVADGIARYLDKLAVVCCYNCIHWLLYNGVELKHK